MSSHNVPTGIESLSREFLRVARKLARENGKEHASQVRVKAEGGHVLLVRLDAGGTLAATAGPDARVGLAGPVRLRVDYRVFKLGSGALYSPAHRIYAGLNLAF